jgi:hypothetical protein
MAEEKEKGTGAEAGKNPPSPPAPPAPPKAEPTKVRVIIPEGGTLGPKLLVNGDETDDADYVAILKQKGQKKVEAVK